MKSPFVSSLRFMQENQLFTLEIAIIFSSVSYMCAKFQVLI